MANLGPFPDNCMNYSYSLSNVSQFMLSYCVAITSSLLQPPVHYRDRQNNVGNKVKVFIVVCCARKCNSRVVCTLVITLVVVAMSYIAPHHRDSMHLCIQCVCLVLCVRVV